MEIVIQASAFKNKCLQLLNDVQHCDTYLITKRGVPFAKLISLQSEKKTLFASMKHSFSENESILGCVDAILS